jgi:hypothetical protein
MPVVAETDLIVRVAGGRPHRCDGWGVGGAQEDGEGPDDYNG